MFLSRLLTPITTTALLLATFVSPGVRGQAPFGVLTEKEGPRGEEILIRSTSGNRSLVLFDRGDEVVVQAGDRGIRFLLVSGKPIKEPVAWYGPIVMNTEEELRTAIRDLQRGTFIS